MSEIQKEIDLKKVEIIVKHNKKNDMLAQVTVKYEAIIMHGFRVMRSDHEPGSYIQPPCYRTSKGWKPLTFFDNPHQWHELQEMIRERFEKTPLSTLKNEEEEFDLDEITQGIEKTKTDSNKYTNL